MKNNEETKVNYLQKIQRYWQNFSLGKKVLVGITGLLVILFLGFVVLASLNGIRYSGVGLSNSSYDNFAPSVQQRAVSGGVGQEEFSYNTAAPAPTAENFETRDYLIHLETRSLDRTCSEIETFKSQSGVLFLSSNKSTNSCYFNFKAANSEAENIIAILKAKDPKSFQEKILNIKKQLENNLNRRDILSQNLKSTEQILEEAILDYDRLQEFAVTAQDATSLATAIREKIRLIDDLKQRREQTRQEIDVLNRALADQEDRLNNTYFSVHIQELKYFDGKALANSWKREVRSFINSINNIIQELTIGLLIVVFQVFKFTLYALIAIMILRFGWRAVRKIW